MRYGRQVDKIYAPSRDCRPTKQQAILELLKGKQTVAKALLVLDQMWTS
jgi:hypothetical protein